MHFNDPELRRIYEQFKKSSKRNQALGNAFESAPLPKNQQTGIDPNQILDIVNNLPQDTDLTLGEYLKSFKEIETQVDREREFRASNKPNYIVEPMDNEPTKPSIKDIGDNMKDIRLKLADKFDEKKVKSRTTNPNLFVGKTPAKPQNIFLNPKKQVRPSPQARVQKYGSVDAKVVSDDMVSPLNLKQFRTEED